MAENQEGPDTVEIDRAELLAGIRYDCVTFLSFYLGSDLTLEVPDFHIDIWNELLRLLEMSLDLKVVILKLRKLFAVPREHAKSTLSKLAAILFAKYSPFRFVLYVSKTNGHAKNAIRDIIYWLQTDQETELFGPTRIVKSSETESLWILDLSIGRDETGTPTYKRIIFKALGADQQVRGLLILNSRPEIIIVDDIEDLDNTTTELQPKLDEWFLGSLQKAYARRHIVIFIGNMIRKTSLLARLSKMPSWNPTVLGALVKDRVTGELRPLWQGRWTVDALLAEYLEYRKLGRGYIWEAEMMNLTHEDVLAGALERAVQVARPNPEEIEAGFICIDPAFGQNHWHDDTGITVHVRIRNGTIPIIVDSYRGKLTEDELFDKLLEFSYAWGITTWFIESDAAQKVLLSYFRLLLRIRKMNENLFVMLPISSGGTKKAGRIIAFRNSVSSGSYAICDSEDELITKLIEYTPDATEHDDLVDSAAYGPVAWNTYGETVTVQGIQQVAMLIMQGSEGAGRIQFETEVASF
jgi:hypothetical protein